MMRGFVVIILIVLSGILVFSVIHNGGRGKAERPQAKEWEPEPLTHEEFGKLQADLKADRRIDDVLSGIEALKGQVTDMRAALDTAVKEHSLLKAAEPEYTPEDFDRAAKELHELLEAIQNQNKTSAAAQPAPPAEQKLLTGIRCPDCDGDGELDDGKPCQTCAGDGVLSDGEKNWHDQSVAAEKAREDLKKAVETEEAAKKTAERLPWCFSIEEGRAKAKETGRFMYVAFCNEGCQPCELVKKFIYARAEVSPRLGREFVPVWIYVSDGFDNDGKPIPTNKAAADEYKVKSYPYAVVDNVADDYKVKFHPEVVMDDQHVVDVQRSIAEFQSMLDLAVERAKSKGGK